DSESPQPDPERNDAPDSSTESPNPLGELLRSAGRLAQGRKVSWGALALLCLAAGTVGSAFGSHAVAENDAQQAQRSFTQTSAEIASTLKLSVQREEDLAAAASTFFAGNPTATPREFQKWARWAHALRHYPELQRLGLLTLVRAPELASFEARLSGRPVAQPVGQPIAQPVTQPAAPAAGGLRIVPTGARPYYCLAVAAVARGGANSPPAGLDYCARTPGLGSSRNSGLSVYTAGRNDALAVQTPVYRGGVTPVTVTGRRAAFVGWLREVLSPRVVVDAALRGHAGSAVRLRYRAGSTVVAFDAGRRQAAGQSAKVDLHNGWSARIFGASAGVDVPADGQALALLLGGIGLSALLGLLVLLLGSARERPPAPAAREPRDDLYDALTGLPNRALTLDLAERMVARAGRQSGMLAGALFIDLDWFGDVNDRLGRTAGDQLLRVVAERLEHVVRTGDTVGRLEGDRFVVLVESAARGVRLDSLARRVIEALHNPVALEDFEPGVFLTASIGVAFGRYEISEDLLRDAQLALQAAKAAGRDRYTLFNANMRSVIEDYGVLEADMNAALQDGQFFLLYQPIYDLTNGRLEGLEAMIRWRHPTRGVLLPDEFIPLAEETGLIVPIGRWVLEEACGRGAAWNVAGHCVGISAMVSAAQLNRDGFATDVRRALQQSGIAPSRLTLEVAETTVMLDVAAATERLQQVKQLGVRIAIDDFGSGYAYRSDLQRMPLDFLKVDRSSLAASDDEDYRSWLLEAILHFGRDLSLTVIAKGIETREQVNAIQAMGCTMAQGYFL
ncbi:MAG TPA: EAL domain-containing protein, partial [Solirubrobacteraceae bacterium]|nr:EAL domain-containing protein [Solirubrobacteraceae bacterium]